MKRITKRDKYIKKESNIVKILVDMATPLDNQNLPPFNAPPSGTYNDTQAFRVLNEALKIPDAIKYLPSFSGNKCSLYDFLNNVDEILDIVKDAEGSPYYNAWLRAIRNKIVDQANDVLNTYGTSLSWAEIRCNLISHYSDKRSETSLIMDLHSLRQNESLETFYSQVIDILTHLTNLSSIHDKNCPEIRKAKSELYNKLCLNVFLAGLRDPIGQVVRSRNPTNIKEAFDFCLREQNIYYTRNQLYGNSKFSKPFQNTPKNNYVKNMSPQQRNSSETYHNNQTPNFKPPINMNNNNQKFNVPQQNAFNNPRFNVPQNNTPNFGQNSQKLPYQQRFSNNANFNQSQRFKFNGQTPMEVDKSGSFNNRYNKPNPFQPSGSKPNYVFEELRNSETYQNLDSYEPNYENIYEEEISATGPENELDEENFPLDCQISENT